MHAASDFLGLDWLEDFAQVAAPHPEVVVPGGIGHSYNRTIDRTVRQISSDFRILDMHSSYHLFLLLNQVDLYPYNRAKINRDLHG
jgi:hypothetical protein